MKKIYALLMIIFMSIVSLSNIAFSEEPTKINDISLNATTNNDINYYFNKHNVLDTKKDIIEICDSFSIVNRCSNELNNKELKCNYSLIVDKLKQELYLNYEIFSDNKCLKGDSLSFEIVLINDGYYVVSRYGYEDLSKLVSPNVSNYSLLYTCYGDSLLGDISFEGGGGAGSGSFSSTIGAAIGAGATALAMMGTNSSNSTTVSYQHSEEELQKILEAKEIRRSITDTLDDLLKNEENDYGWSRDELKTALNKSIKISIGGNLANITLDKLRKKITVVLGIYIKEDNGKEDAKGILQNYLKIDSYDEISKTIPNSIVFSCDEWNTYSKIYGEGMWLLNKAFLLICMNVFDCQFLLVRNPNHYYDKLNGVMRPKGNGRICSYSRELQCIHHNGYNWNCQIDENIDERCAVYANR